MKRLRLVGANWYPYPGRACDDCGREHKRLDVTDSGRTLCRDCCGLAIDLTDEPSREQSS